MNCFFCLNLHNLTLVPCSRDAFPTSLTQCGTLDGILSRWDFMVKFCGGDPMDQQSQAQAQAQISALQQQNAMLNQHLHSQAQSHINHLQQLIPLHQPPQPFQPTSASFQSTPQPPVPQAPDPPAPAATPANQSGPSTPFNLMRCSKR